MSLSDFSSNYSDRSNDYGFQFEFQCQKCRNGFLSSFKASKMGIAAGILRGVSSLFGGRAYGAANATSHLKDALRGSAWDTAFREAVAEVKGKFKQCGRCGNWVCPERCWNPKHSQCETCAPELSEEAASIKARSAVENFKPEDTAPESIVCASCGHENEGGKFCGNCGKGLTELSWVCVTCKTNVPASSSFCGSCGSKRS